MKRIFALSWIGLLTGTLFFLASSALSLRVNSAEIKTEGGVPYTSVLGGYINGEGTLDGGVVQVNLAAGRGLGVYDYEDGPFHLGVGIRFEGVPSIHTPHSRLWPLLVDGGLGTTLGPVYLIGGITLGFAATFMSQDSISSHGSGPYILLNGGVGPKAEALFSITPRLHLQGSFYYMFATGPIQPRYSVFLVGLAMDWKQ